MWTKVKNALQRALNALYAIFHAPQVAEDLQYYKALAEGYKAVMEKSQQLFFRQREEADKKLRLVNCQQELLESLVTLNKVLIDELKEVQNLVSVDSSWDSAPYQNVTRTQNDSSD